MNFFVTLFLLCSSIFCLVPSPATASVRPEESGDYRDIIFLPNHGQEDYQTKFIGEGPGVRILLTCDSVVFFQNAGVVEMRWGTAPCSGEVQGEKMLEGRAHFYKGSDPSEWVPDVPMYSRVRYKNVFPGIDLMFYGQKGQLEHDWIVHSAGNASDIAFRFGVSGVKVNSDGDIVLGSTGMLVKKPYGYFLDSRNRKESVGMRFFVDDRKQVHFNVGSYDRSTDLVIDPIIQLSSSLGTLSGRDVTVDHQGNIVVVGVDGYTAAKGEDAFVMKLRPGGKPIFRVVLGGSGNDSANRVTLDPEGNIYVLGTTGSSDFPVTDHAYDRKCGTDGRCNPFREIPHSDAFAAKLSTTGRLQYATYWGGAFDDRGMALSVDSNGMLWIATYTFARGGTLARLNRSGSQLLFSRQLDSQGASILWALAQDSLGHVYAAAETLDPNLPVVGGFHTSLKGPDDGYVAEFSADGSTLLFSTYLGGNKTDEAKAIAVDSFGNVIVSGETTSNDFPLKNAVQTNRRGRVDVFITKFRTDGAGLIYSTYWGGSKNDHVAAIDVDAPGNLYLGGFTNSPNLQLKNAVQDKLNQGGTRPVEDVFLLKLDPGGSQILYSTYFGGHGVDLAFGVRSGKNGATFVVGETGSEDFPLVHPFSTLIPGGFIVKLRPSPNDH